MRCRLSYATKKVETKRLIREERERESQHRRSNPRVFVFFFLSFLSFLLFLLPSSSIDNDDNDDDNEKYERNIGNIKTEIISPQKVSKPNKIPQIPVERIHSSHPSGEPQSIKLYPMTSSIKYYLREQQTRYARGKNTSREVLSFLFLLFRLFCRTVMNDAIRREVDGNKVSILPIDLEEKFIICALRSTNTPPM